MSGKHLNLERSWRQRPPLPCWQLYLRYLYLYIFVSATASRASRGYFVFGLPSLYYCNLHSFTLCAGLDKRRWMGRGYSIPCHIYTYEYIAYIYLEHVLPATAASWRQLVKIQFDIFLFCLFLTAFNPVINCTLPKTPKIQSYYRCTLCILYMYMYACTIDICISVDFN